MREQLKNELVGWKPWETGWLVIATLLICIVTFLLGNDILGLIAAVSGIITVILGGKGKLSTYFVAIIHILTYAYISFNAKYYGIVMLNILYYLPMQFYGYYVWKKNMNPDTHEVYKKKMSSKNTIILIAVVFISTIIYGFILQLINGNLPFVDALSTVVAVIGLYIAIKMYAEQWILWIIVNVITLAMWIWAFSNGTGSIPIFLMSITYLINSVLMYFKWRNEANNNN